MKFKLILCPFLEYHPLGTSSKLFLSIAQTLNLEEIWLKKSAIISPGRRLRLKKRRQSRLRECNRNRAIPGANVVFPDIVFSNWKIIRSSPP